VFSIYFLFDREIRFYLPNLANSLIYTIFRQKYYKDQYLDFCLNINLIYFIYYINSIHYNIMTIKQEINIKEYFMKLMQTCTNIPTLVLKL
jgi:hypothetical protein